MVLFGHHLDIILFILRRGADNKTRKSISHKASTLEILPPGSAMSSKLLLYWYYSSMFQLW
jgi:hypothetical protein